MMPAPPATAAPCTAAIVINRVWLSVIKVLATISAAACASCVSAVSCRSRPAQNALPGAAQNQHALLCIGTERLDRGRSTPSSIQSLSAFRRSGRFKRDNGDVRTLFFDENDRHKEDDGLTSHNGIRQAYRMPARCVAGAQASDSDRAQSRNICAGLSPPASGTLMR